jgi:N6-adenosine-specific RNA methylase IME4
MKTYSTIVADPPWMERGGGAIKRGADRHYPLLHEDEILSTILQAPVWRPDDNAHLYLWVTNNFLPSGLRIMDGLGFRYVTNVVWVKDRPGLGQYFRGQHELLLFGVRKRAPKPTVHRTDRKDLKSAVFAPRERHSAKPPYSYDLIEARSKGPYLELFARRSRPGWDVWGNEAPS